jgi:hypothetical protein
LVVLFVLTVLAVAGSDAACLRDTTQEIWGRPTMLDAPVDSRAPSTGTIANVVVSSRFSDDALQQACVPAEPEAHVFLDCKE